MVRSTTEEKGKKTRKRKLCPHGKQKYFYAECDGQGICAHGKHKQFCEESDGSGLCGHGKRKFDCMDCGWGCLLSA